MTRITLNILFLISNFLVLSQQLDNPNFALASHPMKVTKISHTTNEIILSLSIENQSETGTFCADKDIYIQDLDSKKKYQLIKSQGIPVCPSSYKFKFVGEILGFQLYFPKINSSTKYITVVENCNQYCFLIKGIILDSELNEEIDKGYSFYANQQLDLALQSFKTVIQKSPDYPFGIYYYNLVQIYAEKEDYTSAKEWCQKIVNSQFEDKNELILRLKQLPYYNKLF